MLQLHENHTRTSCGRNNTMVSTYAPPRHRDTNTVDIPLNVSLRLCTTVPRLLILVYGFLTTVGDTSDGDGKSWPGTIVVALILFVLVWLLMFPMCWKSLFCRKTARIPIQEHIKSADDASADRITYPGMRGRCVRRCRGRVAIAWAAVHCRISFA